MNSARTTRAGRRPLTVGPNVWPTLLGAVVLFVLAAHERLIWPQVLGCVLVAMVATSFAAVVRPVAFDVDVEAPDRVVAGEPFDLAIQLRMPSSQGRRSVVVRCRWRARRPLMPGLVVFADTVSETTVMRARATALARGVSTGIDVDIEIAGAFGFFSRQSRYSVPQRLVVLPAHGQPLQVLTGTGRRPGTVPGYLPDVDVRGVREWRSGDRINEVHWRSVVRTGRMTVVERDGGSAGSVTVLVVAPADQRQPVKDSLFESALSIAASTAASALRQGVPVCLTANAKGIGIRHPQDEATLLECFARIDVARPPSDALLDHVLAHAAHGGVVLVAMAKTVPRSVRARIFDASATMGAIAIDLTAGVEGTSASAPAMTQVSA